MLCCSAIVIKTHNTFTNEENPARVSYVLSAVKRVWLLWLDTGNEIHIAKHVRTYTEADRFLHASERRKRTTTAWNWWCSSSSAARPQCNYTQNFQDDWHGACMETFALLWFLSALGDHACRVRWMVATTAKNSAWNSVHRWSSVYPR
jgi:hypothetical protein